jgi:hypothetical protein
MPECPTRKRREVPGVLEAKSVGVGSVQLAFPKAVWDPHKNAKSNPNDQTSGNIERAFLDFGF